MSDKVTAKRAKCTRCGNCCKNIVCDLGVIFMGTNTTPCPALEYKDNIYWCGLVTNTKKYIFPGIEFTDTQIQSLRKHILKVNNFGEGCDFERWKVVK